MNNNYFITRNNFQKYFATGFYDVIENGSNIYESIYPESDLSKFINLKEAKKLENIKIFLNQPDVFVEMAKKNKKINYTTANLRSKSIYTFINHKSPKFHASKSCSALLSDYKNIIVPVEIFDRGEDELEKFRLSAYSIKTASIEYQLDYLKKKFNLKSNLDIVEVKNSGAKDFSGDTKDSIVGEIFEYLEKAQNMIEKNKDNKIFIDNIYARPFSCNLEILDSEARLWVYLKSDLLKLIMRYHLVMSGKSDLFLPQFLLESCGFENCRSCC